MLVETTGQTERQKKRERERERKREREREREGEGVPDGHVDKKLIPHSHFAILPW